MRITCSKRDDVIRQRDEYNARYLENKAKYDEQYTTYQNAQNAVTDAVKSSIESELSECAQHIDIDIDTRPAWITEGGVSATVRSYDHDVFNESKALSWTWEVKLAQDGTVIKETSSWSGLQATTAEQIESLEWVVKALKILNSMDWEKILNVRLPKYTEYVTVPQPSRADEPNFNQMLMEADIEDGIGQPVLFEGKDGSWFGILRATPTQYSYYTVSEYQFDDFIAKYQGNVGQLLQDMKGRARNMTKAKLVAMLKNPVKTFQVGRM